MTTTSITEMKRTAPATKADTPIAKVAALLTAKTKDIAAVLPANVPVERFKRVVLNAVQQNPDLLKAKQTSLFLACQKCAQDGLIPDGREAALTVFGEQAAYIPMVGGILKKMRNSGEIATISVQVVHEHDVFDYELGDSEFIKHKPKLGNRGNPIGAYSIVKLKSGEVSREVMSVDEIEAVRKRSRASGKGPWVSDWSEMARKTVLKRHAKRLPSATEDGAMPAADDDDPDQPAPVEWAEAPTLEREEAPPPPPAEPAAIEGEVVPQEDGGFE